MSTATDSGNAGDVEAVAFSPVPVNSPGLPGSIAEARARLVNGWTAVSAYLLKENQSPAPDGDDLNQRVPQVVTLVARAKSQADVGAYLHLRALAGDQSVIATYPIIGQLLGVGNNFGGFHSLYGKLFAFRAVNQFNLDTGFSGSGPVPTPLGPTPIGDPVPPSNGNPQGPVTGTPAGTITPIDQSTPPTNPGASTPVPNLPNASPAPTGGASNPIFDVVTGESSFTEASSGTKVVLLFGLALIGFAVWRVLK